MVKCNIKKRAGVNEGSNQGKREGKSWQPENGVCLPELRGSCADLLPPPRPAIATWSLIASNGFFREPNTAPSYNAVDYYDPVQGHTDDCHFIAALSSIAWSKPDKITKVVESGLDKFIFYDPSTVPPHSDTVKVTENLPKDSSGNLIFAKCDSRSPVGESWPMIYEKAYASWKVGGGDTPPIGNLTGGNALTSIQNVTAWTTVNEKTAANTDVAGILRPQCDSVKNYKALWPIAAWTLNGNPGATIYANHSYSILGVPVFNNVDYIVLRDPYGGRIAEPTADIYATGTWNGIDLANPNDGTFALKLEKFRTYFWKYGYVKSP